MRKTVKFRGNNLVYSVNGTEVSKAEFDASTPDKELGEPLAAQLPGAWPMVSEACAVHPSQVAEATELARSKGVPTQYDGLGRPILTDRGHRKAYNRAFGLRDNNGGFGD